MTALNTAVSCDINFALMVADRTKTPIQQWRYVGSYNLWNRDAGEIKEPHFDSDIGSYSAFDNIETGERATVGYHWEEGIYIYVGDALAGYVGTIDNDFEAYVDDVASAANPGAAQIYFVDFNILEPLDTSGLSMI